MTQRSTEQPRGGGACDSSVSGTPDSSLQQAAAAGQSDLLAGRVSAPDGAEGNIMHENNPAAQFAKSIPAIKLKLESRACGLIAAWMRDTVILVDGLRRAEDM